MIPLTSLGTTDYTTGPGSIKRFNMFNTSVINGTTANGASSGQAMEILEQIAREKLPENIGVEWSGLSYQEKQAGGQTGLILSLVFLFVFLFLAALLRKLEYSGSRIDFTSGSRTRCLCRRCNLRSGKRYLLPDWSGNADRSGAKNAILIVEFAKDEVDKGRDVVEAALYAAQLRFRPILMTSLAFILGMLPMVIASGPGSASRQAIGTGVFFGMLVAVTVGIVLVPFFFVMIYKTTHKLKQLKK